MEKYERRSYDGNLGGAPQVTEEGSVHPAPGIYNFTSQNCHWQCWYRMELAVAYLHCLSYQRNHLVSAESVSLSLSAFFIFQIICPSAEHVLSAHHQFSYLTSCMPCHYLVKEPVTESSKQSKTNALVLNTQILHLVIAFSSEAQQRSERQRTQLQKQRSCYHCSAHQRQIRASRQHLRIQRRSRCGHHDDSQAQPSPWQYG